MNDEKPVVPNFLPIDLDQSHSPSKDITKAIQEELKKELLKPPLMQGIAKGFDSTIPQIQVEIADRARIRLVGFSSALGGWIEHDLPKLIPAIPPPESKVYSPRREKRRARKRKAR